MSADASPTTFARRESLSSQIVRVLSERIKQEEYPRGSKMPTEKALMEELGVSRTVVREAFARLAAKGLLKSRRGAGAFVPDDAAYPAFELGSDDVSRIEDVIKLLEMRVGFESEMAAVAAERRTADDLDRMRAALDAMTTSGELNGTVEADAAFHAAIARATHNPYFERFCDFLGSRLVPSRRLYLQGSDSQFERRYARIIDRDHQAIFRAIAAGSAANARRAARKHMLNSLERHRSIRDAAHRL